MRADAIATRVSVLSRTLPLRVLLVDDDELERELMADRLHAAGYEVTSVASGQEALQAFDARWFPVVVTDWEMPGMSGIEFTERLRGRGVDDTYVIMLTVREGGMNYERGYSSGVDDYLTKKLPDTELLARVQAAFNTLALRRSLKEARSALQGTDSLDPQSGALSEASLHGRLEGEMARAQRYGRTLSVMLMGVRAIDPQAATLDGAVLSAVVNTLQRSIRLHVDFIARLPPVDGTERFAIALTETGPAESVIVKQRIEHALVPYVEGFEEVPRLFFSFGFACTQQGPGDQPTQSPADLLTVAEQCRRCAQTHGSSQLATVQGSVEHNVTIACRHGYAVESHCSFKVAADAIGTIKLRAS